MRSFPVRKLPYLAVLIFVLALSHPAGATIFTTPVGAVANSGSGNEAVAASADFELSGGTLTITLTNTLAGIHDAGQLLTDVFFTLNTGSATLSTQTGDLVNVASDKTITDLGSSPLGWGFGSATVNSLSGFELCVICQGGPSAHPTTPTEGILGPDSGDGKYDNANPSIAGNGPHNPFIRDSAVFTLTGIAPGATFGNVIFSFSTTPGVNVAAVPEPGYFGLLGLGAIAMAWAARRNARRARVTD